LVPEYRAEIRGIDISTQVYDQELTDFDIEVNNIFKFFIEKQ